MKLLCAGSMQSSDAVICATDIPNSQNSYPQPPTLDFKFWTANDLLAKNGKLANIREGRIRIVCASDMRALGCIAFTSGPCRLDVWAHTGVPFLWQDPLTITSVQNSEDYDTAR